MVDTAKGLVHKMAILGSFGNKYHEVGLTKTTNSSNKIYNNNNNILGIVKS